MSISVFLHDLSLDNNAVHKNSEYGKRVENLTCVPVLAKYASNLNEVFSKLLKDAVASDDCFLIGRRIKDRRGEW